MTWFKVDDGFWSHPKVLNLSDEAVALWVRAGSYCCQHLTDGFVSSKILRVLGEEKAASELVDSGLWKEIKTGYKFHDWAEYQETSDAVKERRKQARDRMRKVRERRKSSSERSQDVRANNTRTTPERSQEVQSQFATPDPTRPDHILSTSKEVLDQPPVGRERTRNTYPQTFEDWWQRYPKKVGKRKALAEWRRATKRIDRHELNRKTDMFAEFHANEGTEEKYIPNPTTWLNRDGWLDELIPRRVNRPQVESNSMDAWLGKQDVVEGEVVDWTSKGELPW